VQRRLVNGRQQMSIGPEGRAAGSANGAEGSVPAAGRRNTSSLGINLNVRRRDRDARRSKHRLEPTRSPLANRTSWPAPGRGSSSNLRGWIRFGSRAADNVADGFRSVAPYLAVRPGSEVLVVCHGVQSIALYAVQPGVAFGSASDPRAGDSVRVRTPNKSLLGSRGESITGHHAGSMGIVPGQQTAGLYSQ
jgi:hypothetical protein